MPILSANEMGSAIAPKMRSPKNQRNKAAPGTTNNKRVAKMGISGTLANTDRKGPSKIRDPALNSTMYASIVRSL
jgi:hypothetical protein